MICMRYLWKPTFERQLIFGCAFEGILRFAFTFGVPTTVLWGEEEVSKCHWLMLQSSTFEFYT